MDAYRFDAVVRSLGAVSRRAALWGFFGVAVSGLTASRADFAIARRRKKKNKKQCKGGKKKCGKTCIPKTECCGGCGEQLCCNGTCAECCSDADCLLGSGLICQQGTCACPAGEEICEAVCVDLANDGGHCGSCTNACPTNACFNGACSCGNVDDCPDGCICGARKGGGAACASNVSTQPCDEDADCPLGGYCTSEELCAVPCT